MRYNKQPTGITTQLSMLKQRSLIFTAIQDIEVALRTRIIHFFSLSHGALWFMKASKFNNRNIFQTCLDNIQMELSRSKEEFLQEHFAKYGAPSMPPVWKTLEVVSFGNLSKLYANMKDVEVKIDAIQPCPSCQDDCRIHGLIRSTYVP